MKTNNRLAIVFAMGVAIAGSSAFAANEKAVKKAENAMRGACKKEYAKEVKGKPLRKWLTGWKQKSVEQMLTHSKRANATLFMKNGRALLRSMSPEKPKSISKDLTAYGLSIIPRDRTASSFDL